MTRKARARAKKAGPTPGRKPALPGWPEGVPVPPWVLTTENGGMAATPRMVAGLTWESRWAAFRETTPAWAEVTASPEPVYALPDEVIDELAAAIPPAGESRAKKPLITAAEADVERAFQKLCRSHGAGVVGVWNGRPVRYDLLGPPPPPVQLTQAEFDALGWGRLKEAGLSDTTMTYGAWKHDQKETEKAAARARVERLAAAGWIVFDRDYRAELDHLKSRAEQTRCPLPWPFVPGGLAGGTHIPAGATKVGPAGSRLIEDLKQFCRKWKIASLMTWELPEPQGPLNDVPLGVLARILDPGTPAATSPGYGRAQARRPRRRPRSPLGTATTPPPGAVTGKKGHPSRYATGFRMWFAEHAARSRYGHRRGLADRLAAAFANMYTLTDYRIDQLRRLYIHLFRTSAS